MSVMLFLGYLEPATREQHDGKYPLSVRGPIVIDGDDVGSIELTEYTGEFNYVPVVHNVCVECEFSGTNVVSRVYMKNNGPVFLLRGSPHQFFRALF